MEIRVYDAEFNLKKIVENYISLLWHRCYNEVGDFKITAPATDDNIRHLTMGSVVWVEGKEEAGVIESREITQSTTQNQIVISGRFLESYMDRRLIRPTVNFNGLTEVGMRQLLTGAVAIPMVQLGTLQGFTDTIKFQATYKNLLSYEEKLAKSAGFGFRFRPDFVNKVIYFEVYKGLDHSVNQNDRGRVIFSEEYMNLQSAEYSENSQLYKNVCYIGGEGEGSERTFVTVGDDTLTGLARREVFYDATDITSEDLTQSEYEDKLKQRGKSKLDEDVMAKAFSCQIVPDGNFKYGTHYDVGDIITVNKGSWGISQDERITEITEVYEHGLPTIEPILGTTLPTAIDWEE